MMAGTLRTIRSITNRSAAAILRVQHVKRRGSQRKWGSERAVGPGASFG